MNALSWIEFERNKKESESMRTPCDAGFVCPHWGYEDDSGMGLCKCPDVTEKAGKHNVYPYIMNLEECPLVNVDTPIEKWLKSLDKDVKI